MTGLYLVQRWLFLRYRENLLIQIRPMFTGCQQLLGKPERKRVQPVGKKTFQGLFLSKRNKNQCSKKFHRKRLNEMFNFLTTSTTADLTHPPASPAQSYLGLQSKIVLSLKDKQIIIPNIF